MSSGTKRTKLRTLTAWAWASCSDVPRRPPPACNAHLGVGRGGGPRRGLPGARGVHRRSLRLDARAQGALADQGAAGPGGGDPRAPARATASALLERRREERMDPRGDRERGIDHRGLRRRRRADRPRARARVSRKPRTGGSPIVLPQAVQEREALAGKPPGPRNRRHRGSDSVGWRDGAHGAPCAPIRSPQPRIASSEPANVAETPLAAVPAPLARAHRFGGGGLLSLSRGDGGGAEPR